MNESDKIWMYREMAWSKNRQYDTPMRLVAVWLKQNTWIFQILQINFEEQTVVLCNIHKNIQNKTGFMKRLKTDNYSIHMNLTSMHATCTQGGLCMHEITCT